MSIRRSLRLVGQSDVHLFARYPELVTRKFVASVNLVDNQPPPSHVAVSVFPPGFEWLANEEDPWMLFYLLTGDK